VTLHRPPARARIAALVWSVLAAVAVVPMAAPWARADVRVPTLVGSLQSELGCAGDWDPGCLATVLQPGAGTTYRLVGTLPAGSYEFKVALNGSWSENYGAGGVQGGANLPLAHRGGADDPLRPGCRRRHRAGHRQPAGRSERFYFVMADRFANGTTANDTGGLTGDRLETGLRPHRQGLLPRRRPAGPDQPARLHQGSRHHGDLADALVQEPPRPRFRCRRQRRLPRLLDHRLHPDRPAPGHQRRHEGTHRRGPRPRDEGLLRHHHQPHRRRHRLRSGRLRLRLEGDRALQGRRRHRSTTGPMPQGTPSRRSMPRHRSLTRPTFRTEADATVKVPAWLNDPTLYHNRGNSTFAGESSEYGDFFGLDDLFTERPEVVAGMGDIYQTWVDFGIDGFRIDTVKHVNLQFWQQFIPGILAQGRGHREQRLLHVRRGVRRLAVLRLDLTRRRARCRRRWTSRSKGPL
jgi:hypothetical protein